MSVSTNFSATDTMLENGNHRRYLAVGANAMQAIRASIGSAEPKSILDLPCGHGRVARHLRHAFPDADLYVADIDTVGAEFCASEFKATLLKPSSDFTTLDFGRTFDLIWVGSLITHLDANATRNFFGFVARHMDDRSSAVITSHGPFVAGRLFLAQRSVYGLSVEQETKILSDYMETGYGYCDYSNRVGYGISVCSRNWIAEAAKDAGLQLISHRDHAWDNHQDVSLLRLAPANAV